MHQGKKVSTRAVPGADESVLVRGKRVYNGHIMNRSTNPAFTDEENQRSERHLEEGYDIPDERCIVCG